MVRLRRRVHGAVRPGLRRRHHHGRRLRLPGRVRRDSGPTAEPGARALVGMSGTFACVEPATTDDCDAAAAQLGQAQDVSADLDLESFPVTNGDG